MDDKAAAIQFLTSQGAPYGDRHQPLPPIHHKQPNPNQQSYMLSSPMEAKYTSSAPHAMAVPEQMAPAPVAEYFAPVPALVKREGSDSDETSPYPSPCGYNDTEHSPPTESRSSAPVTPISNDYNMSSPLSALEECAHVVLPPLAPPQVQWPESNFDDWDKLPELLRQDRKADFTPRRPMNIYFIYMRVRRPELALHNPNLSTGELSKLLGKEWNNMSPDQKAPWNELAERLIRAFKKKFPDYQYERGGTKRLSKRPRPRSAPGGLSIVLPSRAMMDASYRIPHGMHPYARVGASAGPGTLQVASGFSSYEASGYAQQHWDAQYSSAQTAKMHSAYAQAYPSNAGAAGISMAAPMSPTTPPGIHPVYGTHYDPATGGSYMIESGASVFVEAGHEGQIPAGNYLPPTPSYGVSTFPPTPENAPPSLPGYNPYSFAGPPPMAPAQYTQCAVPQPGMDTWDEYLVQ